MKRSIILALPLLVTPVFAQTQLFAPREDVANVPNAACTTIIDANRDNRPDIAVCAGRYVYLLLQSPTSPGSFSNKGAVVDTGNGNVVVSVAAGDFNQDGKQDLAVATQGSLLIYLGNGDGTFQAPSTIVAAGIGAIAVADLNHDRKQDIIVSSSSENQILLGNGTGVFSNAFRLVSNQSSDPTALVIGEFNQDLNPDIALGYDIFLGNGSGAAGIPYSGSVYLFNNELPLTGGIDPQYSAGADFNGDGSEDLVGLRPGAGVRVWLGNGDGTFQLPLDPSLGPVSATASFAGLGAADFDLDGRPDLAILETGGPPSLDVFLGTGAGEFQSTPLSLPACGNTQLNAPVSNAPNPITVGDLNGDGIPDVIVSCGSGNMLSIFLSVQPSVFLETSANPSQLGQTVALTAIVASPSTGVVYTTGFEVQLYDGSTPLSTPIPLSHGRATIPISTLAAGIHYLNVTLLNAMGEVLTTSAAITQVVSTSTSTCAADVTADLTISGGGFRRDPATGQYSQTVTMTNNSKVTVTAPLSLALHNLPSSVTALNTDGIASCGAARGAPYVDSGLCPGSTLAPGHSISIALKFDDPSNVPIRYTAAALDGFLPR